MFKLLSDLAMKWRLARLRRTLGHEIQRRHIPVVEIEVKPSQLTLKSFAPDKKTEAWAGGDGWGKGQRIEFYHSIWDGTAHFPFWGKKLQISLSAGAPRPSSRQLDDVRQIITHPTSMRNEIEAALFSYYETRIYHVGAVNVDEKPLPKLRNAKQIHKVLRGPTIHPCRDADDEESNVVEFKLHFGCDWDDVHGLDVHIEGWQIKKIE